MFVSGRPPGRGLAGGRQGRQDDIRNPLWRQHEFNPLDASTRAAAPGVEAFWRRASKGFNLPFSSADIQELT